MLIKQTHHFHAAHRNQGLIGEKCFSLHGHTYYAEFGVYSRRTGTGTKEEQATEMAKKEATGITVAFSHIHEVIAPIVKELDHALLIDAKDPWEGIVGQMQVKGQKVKWFSYPTSAENLCFYLFDRVMNAKGNLELRQINFRETTSTILQYDFDDYMVDLPVLGKPRK